MIIFRWILLRMKNVSEKSCRGNQNTFYVQWLFPKIVPYIRQCEKYGRSGNAANDHIILRMRVACSITKVTDTHSEYEILIAFSWKQWLRERASILLLHVHCLCSSFSVQYFIANICWKFSFTDFRDLLLIFKVVCVLNTAENCKLRLLQTDIDLVRK
jgi:hypothetical protein